ncbi:MAG: hypothetical protein ACOCUS_04225 [Polyangiales bacterium]
MPIPYAIEEDADEPDEQELEPLDSDPPRGYELVEGAQALVTLYREVREELTAAGQVVREARRVGRAEGQVDMIEVEPGVWEPCPRAR